MTNDPDLNPLDALRRSVDDTDGLDPTTADRLEARLRIAHAEARPAAGRRLRPALAALGVLAVVVALSVGVVVRGSDPVSALVVTDAENVTVRLPDGTLVVDPNDGYRLPDGAVVEIGSGGMVTIDDVVLDTAGILEVRDGRLVADVVGTTTTPERPDHLEPEPTTTEPPADVVTTTTTPPATTTLPAAPEPTDRPAPSESTTTTTARTEPEPRDDDRLDDGESGDRDRPRDDDRARDGSGDEPDETAVTVAISLTLDRLDDGVRVAWSVDGLADGWSVVIVRAIGDGGPTPILTTGEPAGELIDRPTREDGRLIERRLRYRIVVLDEAGGEVASGPSQSLR